MALSTEERSEGSRDAAFLMFEELKATARFDLATLRGAFNAIDDYLDANAVAINTAFPQPFRGNATVSEKAFIVAAVALRRAGKSPRR